MSEDRLASPIFFISMIYEIDIYFPFDILKLQNLIVWSNWSIFYLNNSLLIDVLVFISYFIIKYHYVHYLSCSYQLCLSLTPGLLLKFQHPLQIKLVSVRLQGAQVSWFFVCDLTKSVAPSDSSLQLFDWHEPCAGLVCRISMRRILGFVGLSPILFWFPQSDLQYFFVIEVILDNILLDELVFGSELVVDWFSNFSDFSRTIVSITTIVCVFNSVIVMWFFYYWEYFI